MGRLGLGFQPFALRFLSIQMPLECVGEGEGQRELAALTGNPRHANSSAKRGS